MLKIKRFKKNSIDYQNTQKIGVYFYYFSKKKTKKKRKINDLKKITEKTTKCILINYFLLERIIFSYDFISYIFIFRLRLRKNSKKNKTAFGIFIFIFRCICPFKLA